MSYTLPTDSELEILQVLWANGLCTVRFVNDKINEHREVGYTSTLKTMQLMMDKNMLDRVIEERTHYYKAALAEETTQKSLLDEFVASTFRGSASSLVLRMLGDGDTNLDEIQKIKAIISEFENQNQNL
ncbi:MAG: BlaI/MecI/CopY family transcriptional regulator [Saprospiraceae bacterium]|nr:BlaI/MecI/CopY family transcriptional regulator [Saprospiraceae bacterium]